MKVYSNDEIEQGSDSWLNFRKGKYTGTKIGKMFAKSRKSGEVFDFTKRNLAYYELLAENLAVEDEDGLSSSRERGHALESEALDRLERELGLEIVRGGVWELDDSHIESPDGYTKDLKCGFEVKCLATARHLQSMIEHKAPEEYMAEYANYFLVNDKMEKLYVVLYDPRLASVGLDVAFHEITREDMADYIEALNTAKQEASRMIGEDMKALFGMKIEKGNDESDI